MMEAIRRIEKVVGNQVTVTLPESFRERHVDIIVLPLEDPVPVPPGPRRRPAPELANTEILSDIMAQAVPEEDWDALR